MHRLAASFCLLLTFSAGAEGRPALRISGWVTGMKATETAFVTIVGPAVYRATTSPSGKWSAEVRQPGKYRVTPSANNYTFRPLSRWVTLTGASRGAINFKAISESASIGGLEIVGRIVGLVGGEKAEILASGPNELRAVSGPGGSFEIKGAKPGRYVVKPNLAGYKFRPASRKIKLGPARNVKIRFKALKAGARRSLKPWLRGNVSGLSPGEFAIIRGVGRRRFTYKVTRNGHYEIKDMHKGRYRIWIDVPHCNSCGYIPGPLKADIIQRGKTRIDFKIIR